MTILFLALWLQISAHPVTEQIITDVVEVRMHCQMGVCVQIPLDFDYSNLGNGDRVPTNNQLNQEYAEAAQRAADETDGKQYPLGVCKIGDPGCDPPLPPSGSIQCWNDSTTHDYLCEDGSGRHVDVTKALMKLLEPPAESVDVPAVQVGMRLVCSTTTGEMCTDYPMPIYSCKDKSRILEHDENSPPKYWCRKVEF